MHQRSMALVARGDAILMVRQHLFGRDFFTLPGGGVEQGETPAAAAVRELWEECGVKGEVLRPLVTITREDGGIEHTFLVEISDSARAIVGYDPELSGNEQIILDVQWKRLRELDEKDRAFLWSYGLLEVEAFRKEALGWEGSISYPGPEEQTAKSLTANEYQALALKTLNPALDLRDVLINGVMGLCGESGEAIDLVKKHLAQGHSLDKEQLAKELGDVAWYLAETAHAIGYPLQDILQMNIEKLKRRYPAGFDSEKSVKRDFADK